MERQMARTTSTSNPTGLVEIDRKDVTVDVMTVGRDRYVSVPRLNLTAYKLPATTLVVCIARAGNTTHRIELGALAAWDKASRILTDLAVDAPLRFRLLFHEAGKPMLLASCENIRPRNNSDAESLLPMEPADLGEELWRFKMQADGPVILYNREVFATASAATGFPPFQALVMPEALRQVCRELARAPARLSDESDVLFDWGQWLDGLGVDRPPGADEEESVRDTWVDEVVEVFAARFKFASLLRRNLAEVGND
jgi:hypothetical protein